MTLKNIYSSTTTKTTPLAVVPLLRDPRTTKKNTVILYKDTRGVPISSCLPPI